MINRPLQQLMIIAALCLSAVSIPLTVWGQTVQRCVTGNTVTASGTASSGAVIFSSPGDFAPGQQVADVEVELTWSVAPNACGSGVGGSVDLSDIGFELVSPTGTRVRLVQTAAQGGATYSGTTAVNSLVTSFAFGGAIQGSTPAAGTYAAAQPLSAYWGENPAGSWTLDVIHDGGGSSPVCVENFCVQVTACTPGSLAALCQATATVALDASGNYSYEFVDLDNGSDTTCYLQSVVFSPATASCADIGAGGPVTVQMTLRDRLGNTDFCFTDVTVEDVTAPEIDACAAYPAVWDTIYLDNTGVGAYAAASAIVATDACGVINELVSEQVNQPFTFGAVRNFDCSNKGTNNIFFQAPDASGNVQTFGPINGCRARVVVFDTIAPIALCQDTTVYLDNTGNATINGSFVDNGSNDVCTPANVLQYQLNGAATVTYNASNLGVPNNVTLTVVETQSAAQGGTNTASCSALVTVLDTTAPTAICRNLTVDLDAAGNATLLADSVGILSTDNSGSPLSFTYSGGATTVSYDCSNLGTNTVTIIVIDPSGNRDSCTATITVRDVTPPTVICQPATIYLDNNGQASLSTTDVDNGSSDVCDPAPTFLIDGQATLNYGCGQLGTGNTVTLTVEDASGNIDSCQAAVTVLDTVAPVANCQNITVYLDAAGQVVVNAADVNNTGTPSSDNCGIVNEYINNQASISFDCSAVGAVQTVSYLVEDASSNRDSCTANITVLDTINPVALCQNITVALDATGQAVVSAAAIDNGSSDNCPAFVLSINGQTAVTYDCTNLGNNTATLVIEDASGRRDSCQAVIEVLDQMAPNMQCQASISLPLDATGNASVSPADLDNGSTDNCTTLGLTVNGQSSVSFNCSQLNNNTVWLIGTDGSGNMDSCFSIVNVQDTTSPVAQCLNIDAYLDATGLATVLPADVDDNSVDNCGIINYTVNNAGQVNFSCADIGAQTVTLEVTDANANNDNCLATVTVIDSFAPDAICRTRPLNVSLNPSGQATVLATTIDSASTDNCGTTNLQLNGANQVVFDCDDLGANTVSLVVTDNANNADSCQATVIVNDNQFPLALCQADTAILDQNGAATVYPIDIIDPASGDNCAIVDSTINSAASQLYNCSNLTVLTGVPALATLEITDAAGNPSSCQSQVTVLDTLAPNAICRNITVVLNSTGQVVVSGTDIDGGSTDNCAITSYFIDGANSVTYGCADIGINNAQLIVEDASGNRDTCTATVTVVDNQLPTALCQNITVFLDANGQTVVDAVDIDGGSSDNCSPITLLINNQPSFTYNCAHAGLTVNAQLSVEDPSNNVSFCTAQVTVRDTISPQAICNSPIDIFLNSSGTATVTAAQVNGGSTDNCGVSTVTLSGANSQSFDCSQIGANTVTLIVRDAAGNTDSCVATVNVFDQLAPTADCRNILAYLDNNGQVVVSTTDVDNGSDDNCGTPNLSFLNGSTTMTYSCANLGSGNTLSLVATDQSSNADTCQSLVTVLDTISPVAVCQNISVQVDAVTGQVTVQAIDVDGGSTDNCGTLSYLINGQSSLTYNCSTLGQHTVTLTVTDGQGLSSNCQATITVEDLTAPAVLCQNINAYLDANGSVTILPSDIDNGTTDNCGPVSLSINRQASVSLTCAVAGANVFTLYATDVNGNEDSCQATVTIIDTITPNAICQNIDVYLDANGNATVVPSDIDNGSNDNCTIVSYLINGSSSIDYTCLEIGANAVTLVVEDAAGLQDSCQAIVTVRDTVAPTMLCRTSIFRNLDNNGQLGIQYFNLDNGSFDACGIQTYALSQDSFDCSHIGANVVTLYATDFNGNNDSCTTTLNIQDATAPTASCQNIQLLLDSSGTVILYPHQLNDGSTDNCGIAYFEVNNQDSLILNCSSIGSQLYTLTVYDSSNIQASCFANVSVFDSMPPVAVCQSITVQLDPNGNVTVNATDLDGGSYDNCQVNTILFDDGSATRSFDCSQLGANTANIVVTDANGNRDTCSAIITVEDVTAPIASCQAATVYVDSNGLAQIDPALINDNSTDACTIDSMVVSPAQLNCSNIAAPVTVTLTVFDPSGNFNSCTANVVVQDTVAPTMLCQNATVYVDQNGFVNVPASVIDGGSVDACGPVSLAINGASNQIYTCDSLDLRTAILTATDIYANSNTCQAQLTVLDTVAPDAICRTPFEAILDGNTGLATVQAPQADSASTDNCSLDPSSYLLNGQTALTFDCTDAGTSQNVVLTVTDSSGTSSTCSTAIIVRDTAAPIANCVATLSVNLNAITGLATVNATTLNNNSTDVCAPPLTYLINGQTSYQYTCAEIGNNTAVLTVTDPSGNSSTCSTQVTINDVTSPNAQCNFNVQVQLDQSGQVVVQGIDLDNGSTDNCGVTTYLINGQPSQTFDCSNIGNTLVTLTVQDSTGNPSSCSSVVNVQDTVSPVAVCPTIPVDVYLDSSGIVQVPAASVDSASYDNCGIQTYLINNSNSQSYTCQNIGLNSATLIVRDPSNQQASCPVEINVVDTIAPVAICQDVTVTLNANTGLGTVDATSLDNGSVDNCGINSYQINGQSQATFDCSNAGVNVVTLTVTDNQGTSSQCQSNVTVVDNSLPTISCTSGSVYLGLNGDVTVLPTDFATGNDACGILSWTIDSLPQRLYDCSAINQTFQDTIRASDPSGNTASCLAQITVLDTIAPQANCRNITVQLDSFGNVNIAATQIDNNSGDNCSITTYLINNQPSISFNCADTGLNVATLTVIDPASNSDVCQATITVEDNIAPVVVCQNITVQLNANGTVTVPATSVDNGSFDACGPLSYTINGQNAITYNCTNIGTNQVQLEVIDANGNASSCQATITVEDNLAPTVTCQAFTLYLDNGGNGTVRPVDVIDMSSSSDNCNIFSYTVNGSTTGVNYSCADVGTNTVMVIASDFSNNADTCYATVTVVDTTAPVVNCNNILVNLTASGVDTLTAQQLGVNTNDACGIGSVTISPQVITCADIGVVPVTITATDVNGVSSTCISQVTVVLDGPQPTSNDPLCEGQTLTLFANPPATGFNYNYQWTGPNGFSSTQANPTRSNMQAADEGFYVVTISPQSVPGCSSTDSVFVDVNVVPPPVIAVNAPLCATGQAVFTLDNPSDYSGTNFGYQWFFNGTSIGPNNDTLIINNINTVNSGDYTMIITVDGCRDTSAAPLAVVVNPLPLPFTPLASTPCQDSTLDLDANADTSSTYTYQWTGPNGFSSTLGTPSISPAGLAAAGSYTVTVTDQNSCTATGTVVASITATPQTPDISFNEPLCLDDVLELTDSTVYNATAVYNWFLADSTTQQNFMGQLVVVDALEGMYYLSVTENGCPSRLDSVDVRYEPAPDASDDAFTLNFRDSITGMDVTLNDAVRPNAGVQLVNPPLHGIAQLNTNNTFNYVPDRLYFGIDSFTYEVCDATCPTICDTALVVLDIQYEERCLMPNGLSPNGDGINDEIFIVCDEEYPNMQIRIYSRWGNMVYEGEPTGFNGQFKGADLPDGTYFYILDYGDGTDPSTGYIIIHR
ncbi:gliding motility-associated C-terminal domain-containing protein [Saprospira sp. CCB-QB6]|uniref:T9SS type B sorting domain-containing protein n=1 Tax=Saprospira sp. CCB-QB6 TaxID=3023936 RepID=UPI0023499391|nr:gliding motility-associated C-terminal domain-containing protein [Saprospira sp. CCB-QB6]WCL81687.1 gliding motility-associated C-terminal domain-containing protein [Saprospira sp. CCB-QB6]